jgi:hypothetical protein
MRRRFFKKIEIRSCSKWILTASVSLVTSLQSLPAHADLAALIKDQPQDRVAVMTLAADSPDDGYGILSMSRSDFAQQVSLDDPAKLENAYFKIVEAEGNDALPVGDFDGDNVLYHMMRARAYYAKLAQASGFPDAALDPATARKITVRVRMQNDYNVVLHFAAQPDYDNSRYIPAEPPTIKMINEMNKNNFQSSYTQLMTDLGCDASHGADMNCPNDCQDMPAALSKSATAAKMAKDLVGPYKGFLADLNAALASPNPCPVKESAINAAFNKALVTVDIAPWNQEILFDEKKTLMAPVDWYGLATAAGFSASTEDWVSLSATPLQLVNGYNGGIDGEKIPDVIYHETFHYASDADGLFVMASEGNPVAEDYANYFGSSINGRPEMAEIDEFSGRAYKHEYKKIPEIKDTVPSMYNATSFGTAIFWAIRNQLGRDRADQLVWNSLHYLDGSSLHLDVPKAVSAAAHADTTLTPGEISMIDNLLEKYHQSYVNLEIKFNPGEAKKLLDAETVKKAGADQADHLKKIPDELQANGVDLDPGTASHISDVADSLKDESSKPGFRSKVVKVLNEISKTLKITEVDTGETIGIAGNVVSAAGNTPINFGTDLVSSIIMGHGMLTGKELATGKYAGRDKSLEAELVGATGGVATTYYSYAGLAALGFSFTNIVSTSAFGVVFVNGEVCAKANLKGKSSLDRYCLENAKLANTINSDTARAGATLGTKIHLELQKIGQFFKNLFI